MKYFIGIDSGATDTEVIIVNDKGRVESLKKYKPVNYNLLGFVKSAQLLNIIIKDSLKNIPRKNLFYIAACVSGAGIEKERKKLQHFLSEKFNTGNIKIYPDTAAAFASVFSPDDTNCGVLIAGTGSVLYFRKRKGDFLKIGGWGRHIGDEGSGFWIAREALGKVTQCYDNRMKKTFLAEMIEKKFSINPRNIIKKIYHNNFEVSKIAGIVFSCAEKGDRLSQNIIKKAAEQISHHFIPLKNIHAVIALCGSLFSQEKLLEIYIKEIAREKYPKIKFVKPKNKPVWGAVKLAKAAEQTRVHDLLF